MVDYPRRTRRGPVEASLPRTVGLWFAAIRDVRVAAPLKRAAPCRQQRPAKAIRDVRVAAPLKRRHDRVRLHRGVAIRDVRVAAPLKPSSCIFSRPAPSPYPRRTRRGPVEAIVLAATGALLRSIRDVRVAAPLKQHAMGYEGAARATIRDVRVAAPLKRL